HLSGRRKPQAAERSKRVLKENQDYLTETEILVGLFNQAMEEGLRADSPVLRARLKRYIWTPPGHQPRRFSDQEIAAACAGWKEMLDLWRNLPIGGMLDLEWPTSEKAAGRRSR